MIQKAISDIFEGKNLDKPIVKNVMFEIMDGTATHAQIGAFLAALRMKGESIDEITACAEVMRDKAIKIHPKTEVIDIVGTGGDCFNTFNISTTSSFVVASAGIAVAKHGNRNVSSKCGAADVLESLGVRINLTPIQSETLLNQIGICFMFSQMHHPSMRNILHVRKEMGTRTIFNILGPLSNPAEAKMMLLGVYDEKLVEPIAKVLMNLGVKRGMVVHGSGLDELTLSGYNKICEIDSGTLNTYSLFPEDLGFEKCSIDDLRGGSPVENANLLLKILSGELHGPKRDVVIFNSAVALYIAKKFDNIDHCIKLANDLIDKGSAIKKLEEFNFATRRLDYNA